MVLAQTESGARSAAGAAGTSALGSWRTDERSRAEKMTVPITVSANTTVTLSTMASSIRVSRPRLAMKSVCLADTRPKKTLKACCMRRMWLSSAVLERPPTEPGEPCGEGCTASPSADRLPELPCPCRPAPAGLPLARDPADPVRYVPWVTCIGRDGSRAVLSCLTPRRLPAAPQRSLRDAARP